MAFGLIMEALARIEHKLDALMRWTGVPMPPPMHFVGTQCPACGMNIDYQVDLNHGVVVRRCNCKTGKVPSTIPLLPVTEKADGRRGEEVAAEDGAERGGREREAHSVHRPKR